MSNFNEDDLEEALNLHAYYANQLAEINRVESITGSKNKFKSEIVNEQQKVQKYLSQYFKAVQDGSRHAVSTGTEILLRRKFRINSLDETGKEVKQEMVHIGLDFIHEQFNDGKLFPLSTFFSLVANSGVGKSDYFYTIGNALLNQNYKVMLCSFEFGEERLSNLIAAEEDGGKDRMKTSRKNGKFDNLIVNYYARTLEDLEFLIDEAHLNGIKAILIDSFGEIERNEPEYILQQKLSMMLNAKVNDYGMFIGIILQTNAGEIDGEYTIRGGKDFIYKPDIAIHVKKVSEEDISGDRIVHLFKNRDSDVNGKTIVTKWDAEKRVPTFKENFNGVLADGNPVRGFGRGFGSKK